MTKSHAAVFFFLACVIEREGGRIRPESFPESRPANFHNYSRDYARCEMRIKARINVDPRAGSNGISNARENEQCMRRHASALERFHVVCFKSHLALYARP